MNPTLHTPFSQPIMVQELEGHKDFKKRIVPEIIKEYKKGSDQKAPWGKYCNTWCTNAMGLNLIEFELQKAINSWLSFFKYPFIQYKLDAWYNVHTWNMHQEVHRHLKSGIILCGIYYIQLNEKDKPVSFVDLNNDYMTLLTDSDFTPQHPMMDWDYNLDLKEGDLVLFRPDMFHLVAPAEEKHDEYSISLSFNVEV